MGGLGYQLVLVTTVVCLVYLLLVYASYAMLIIVASLDNAIRSREAHGEDFHALEDSRFTIPVSVLVPIYNEAAVIGPVIESLRRLRYAELEIVVVNDGSTDDTLEVLEQQLELEPTARFPRCIVKAMAVRGTYRSRVDPRILVVDKQNGGKADALNTALNHARYRYVCCVDGDTIYMPDALLNTMRLVVKDPARIIGVTGHIAVATAPEQMAHEHDGRARVENRLIINFQHMEYLRSFLNIRLAWSRMNFMLCSSGAFAIWRRDVLEEIGGFATDFTCEDIEMTFRVHEYFLRQGRDYRILSTPEIVARTEGPASVRGLMLQRERWQRVTMETIWHYRRTIGQRRYGVVGLLGVPFYFLTEVLAPLVELVAIAALIGGILLHIFDWQVYLVFFATLSIANAILTTVAVLMEDISTRAYRLAHLARLVALAPFELLVYRPLLVWPRLKGSWGFVRGDKNWNKVTRNLREADAVAQT